MILIFGSTGFIGKETKKLLDKIGLPYKTVDRNSIEGDSISLDMYLSFEQEELSRFYNDVNAVIYLVGNSSPMKYMDNPELEVEFFLPNLMKIAKDTATFSSDARFIYSSSGGMVYDKNIYHRDEESTLAPETSYGLVKQLSEVSLEYLGRTAGLNYVIARIANPIGKNQCNKEQGVIGAILRSLNSDSEFNLIGSGEQQRDFIDVQDVASAFVELIKIDCLQSNVYNIGSGKAYSINQIIAIICDITKKELLINRVPSRENESQGFVLDSSLIKSDTKWECNTDIHDIIRHLI
ncbi:NAD-dependent epimerase/dehydratase family protein [Bizionia sp.]|uniref:NAD-dependent epimerase/dehydratase family protein n=1 Tax=Bizionia sp. TaxID=1954480 RepID=UPI003A957EE2